MDDPELRRVPDVAEQQDRSEHERAEHRQRLHARVAVQHGHGRERRGHDDPHLWQRSAEGSNYEHGRNDPLPLSGACRLRSFQLPGAAASGRRSRSCSPRWRWPAAAARSGSSRRPRPAPRRSPAEARSTVRSPTSTTTSGACSADHLAVQVVSPTKLQVGAAPARSDGRVHAHGGGGAGPADRRKRAGRRGDRPRPDVSEPGVARGVDARSRTAWGRACRDRRPLECPATPAPGAQAHVRICRCRA